MKTKWRFVVLIAFIGAVFSARAQKNLAVLDFADDLCIYKGYYDADRFDPNRLKDTYTLSRADLFFDGDEFPELEESFKTLKAELINLNLVQLPVFISARDSMLRYIDESFEIQKLRLQAWDNPKVLEVKFDNDSTVHACTRALIAGGDSLLTAYELITKEQMTRNAYPDALWDKFQDNMKRDERYDIAFDYVLTYGWWNRVNNLIYHYDNDGSLTESFYDLFERVVTVDCDEV